MNKCIPCEQAKRAVKKISNIGEAWINVVISNPEVEALAIERLKKCNICNSRVEVLKVNNTSIYKCKECNCPLIALVRSNEKCKLNKW